MLTVKTYLDKSEIAGIGLFAGEFIRKGKQVYKHTGRFTIMVDESEVDQFPRETYDAFVLHAYKGTGDCRLKEGFYYNIDDSKYMNHSATPNLIWNSFLEIYIATVDIEPGTELTCDYGDFAERGDACFNW